MIYLQEGNFPLNEAFSSEIVQEANSTYQLTFKFPTSDPKWALLTPETELVADDLHGEQCFTIFEVEKQHGYVTVYANQVATLLNGYSISKINVDRVNGATVMNALVAGFKRETPFTFFSDVMSKHTLNLKDISAMEALAKDKHSIVGQWGGDLVRDKYSVRLLENGGIENESLFAYKKNMKSFQESKSTKELRTRIHFKRVIEAHEEGKKDQILTVTIDSPLINKYKNIYEADMEVQDQDVVDQKTLEDYGKRYFRETLCDMIEESLEIDVVGQADQPVHMFDIVSIFHEGYNVDLRKKITKYKFNPMSIKLVSIGFGEVTRTLADSISGMVNDSVDKKMKSYDAEYEAKVQKLVDNANTEYNKQAKDLELKITDGIEQAKAQAEVVKQEISAQVTDKIAAANQANKNEIVEEFKAKYNGIEVKMQGLKATTDQLKTSDADIKKLINDFKAQTQSQFVGVQGAQSRFEQTTEKAISDLTNVTNGKADRSYVEQTINGIKEEFTSLKVGSRNYAEDYDFTRGLWFFSHGNSSDSTGTAENGIYTITGNTNTWKQAQLFSSTAPSWATSKTTALDYLEKGEPYTISFYAKRNSGSGTMWASLRENRKAGNNSERIYAQFQLTDDWQLYKIYVPVLEKSDEFDFWRIIIGYSEAGSISFKKVELTQSTTRTDAGPAPEDQEAILSNASASFERTAKGLKTQITALEQYIGESGILESRLKRYTEEQTSNTLKTIRENLSENYISKNKYIEDSEGITRRIEALGTQIDQENLVRLSETLKEYTVSNNNNNNNRFARPEDGIFKMKISGSPSYTWLGPCFPLYIDKIAKGETYSVGFEYMIKSGVEVDKGLVFTLKKHSNNQGIFGQNFADKNTPKDRWLKAEFHFTADRDFEFDRSGNFPFYIYAVNNGEFWIQKPILVKGPKLPPYRPNTLDSINLRIESKLAEYKQTVDGQFSTFSTEFGNNLRYATEGLNNKLATQEQALTTRIANQAKETDSKLQAQADETNQKLSSQNSVLNDKLDDFKDSINGRFANYQQTVNGQVATIISQFDGVLKKTDINITDGQISFGTGKSINGRTISSLLVQEPEAIALIAKLIKVKGDMVVDGSITSRHLASQIVRTGHMESGSVTTQILASNAVTADKLLVDSAMINKLVSNQAFIRELISQKAFITELNSIKVAAERIQGGRLESNTGALVFDLDKSALNMLTDTAVIRRVFNNFPTQFIRYGTHIENGNRFSKTIIGSNRDGTENSGNRTFSGIEIYNSTNEDVEDYTKFYADKLYLQHSEYKQGWIIQNAGKPRIAPLNGTTYSEMIASDFRMIYTADGNHRSVGTYLWDLLTCFGILQKYGWDLKNSATQRHISGVLSKYNYK
nr:MAG TPA: Neck appendage protein [Caudoviricetes sp.]